MTKEWQEASEEYMKVRLPAPPDEEEDSSFDISHLHVTVPRNRAHHRLQGHDGSVQVRERPPRPREDQRRVEESITVSQHTTHTNTDTSFPWVNSLLGTVCVQLQETGRATATVILVLSVQNLEAFARSNSLRLPAQSLCMRHIVHIVPLSIYALLNSDYTRVLSLCAFDLLITIKRNLTGFRHYQAASHHRSAELTFAQRPKWPLVAPTSHRDT